MFNISKGTKIVEICTSLVLLCQPIMHGIEVHDYKNCSKLIGDGEECYKCYEYGENTFHCFPTPKKTYLKKVGNVVVRVVEAIGAVNLIFFDIHMYSRLYKVLLDNRYLVTAEQCRMLQ